MILKKSNIKIDNLFQFSPYIIFLILYSFLYCYVLYTQNIYNSSNTLFTGLPLFTAFITTLYSFFTFKEKYKINKKIEIFISGVAHTTVINYYFSIISIITFNYMLAKTNGILTAVTLSLLYIPASSIMPSIFIVTSLISLIIPSLFAAIIICMPIGYGIAQSLQINPAFMAATIIGGALCANHLSLYFNTIKFKINIGAIKLILLFLTTTWFIFAAAIGTFIILFQYKCPLINPIISQILQKSLTIQDYVTLIPYYLLLILSFLNLNILASTVIASCIALMIEITYHKVMFLDAITTIFNGFYQDSILNNILFAHLIIAGVIKIITYNGGFNYIIKKLNLKGVQSASKVQATIIFIAIIANMLIIIDKLCLNLINYPIKRLAYRYNLLQARAVNLTLITTTILQIILPYASIMFLTIHITHRSYIEILYYMIYPILIIFFTMISICISNFNVKNKQNYL